MMIFHSIGSFIALSLSSLSVVTLGEKYVVLLDSLQDCTVSHPNPAEILSIGTELSSDDEIKGFNARVSLKVPFDETFKFELSLASTTKRDKVRVRGYLCTELNNFIPFIWKNITQIVGVPNTCPIGAGDYELLNYVLRTDDYLFKDWWSVAFVILRDESSVVCKEFRIKQILDENC